jgi:hypothetical protein
MNLRPLAPTAIRLATLAVALMAHPLAGQVGDQGVLVIRADGKDVGLESFKVIPAGAGIRVITKATYSTPRPGVELSGSLDRAGEFDAAIQLGRATGSGSVETYAVLKRSRLTIRRVERGAEEARESPGGPGLVLLADSLFALYLQVVPLATEEGRVLTAVLPQSAKRLSFTARRTASSQPGSQVIRLSGGLEGEIQLGSRGELQRVTLPGIEATRKPD